MSFADFEAQGGRAPAAGGVPRAHRRATSRSRSSAIAELCRAEGIFLIEDCAHAHGAELERPPARHAGATPGVWSFYATKTVSTGEGGMLVSRHAELLEFARAFRNYGKPDARRRRAELPLSEFTAALGLVQAERMEEIVAWKNAAARELAGPRAPGPPASCPDGMISGLYKYIVFDPIERSTGKVYDQPCHRIMGHADDLPNSDWVAEHHWCVPLYYRPGLSAPRAAARRRDRLEHARQRRDRVAPGSRGAL